MSLQSPKSDRSLVKIGAKHGSIVVVFKQPAPIVKKKPKILTEEKYIEEMGKIIQRDFFPDLDKLRAQNEYLDAMERKDYAQMEALRAKYSGRYPSERSGSVTPATFETPATTVGSKTPAPNGTEDVNVNVSDTPKSTRSEQSTTSTSVSSFSDKHSLDSFLQKYTSEDNQSFEEIMERADERLRTKYHVLYRNEQLSTEHLARALILPSIEEQFQQSDEPRPIETWTYKNRNSVMYPPDGVDLTLAEQIDAATKRQSIEYSATRLSANPFNEESRPGTETSLAKRTLLNGKIGLDGLVVTAKSTNVDEGPQVRGFNLVMTPSPRPGEAFSPLMTWGEIEGTPFRLDGGDTPLVQSESSGPGFKISENTRRESIGLALAERAGEKMRAQKQRAMDTARRNMAQRSTPFIRSNIDRLASMSPAARKLATGKLGLVSPLLNTPLSRATTPRRTPSLHSVDRQKAIIGVTRKSTTKPNTSNNTESTLTDNLLQIPSKRLSAADFF